MDFYEAFAHTWGSTGTVDDSLTATQYDQGWNFIGSRPPRLGEFNKREKLIDQRLKWLYDQIKTAADAHGVTLNGSDVGGLLAILQYLIGDHASASDPHGQYQLESSMSAYATLASPNLTGVPTAPTAAPGTNTKQLANTEFVLNEKPQAATDAEMQAGTQTAIRSMSPANVKQAIAANGMTPAQLRSELNATGDAPIYACRAWVRFNGGTTPGVFGSGNITSVTRVAAGEYTLNFAAEMPTTSYSVVCSAAKTTSSVAAVAPVPSTKIASSVNVMVTDNNSDTRVTGGSIDVAIFC